MNIAKAISAALALLVALTLSSTTRVAAQAPELLIRVGAGPVDLSTPLIYAAQAGLYKRAGLDVELVKVASGAVAAAAIAGGSLEIGKSNTMSIVAAIGKGLPFTIVGSIANYSSDNPDAGLLVSTSAQIKTPSDLRQDPRGGLAAGHWHGDHLGGCQAVAVNGTREQLRVTCVNGKTLVIRPPLTHRDLPQPWPDRFDPRWRYQQFVDFG